jgi:hypothetical protein
MEDLSCPQTGDRGPQHMPEAGVVRIARGDIKVAVGNLRLDPARTK